MDLCNLQREGLDILAAHKHNGQAAVPAVRRARVHDDMTPKPQDQRRKGAHSRLAIARLRERTLARRMQVPFTWKRANDAVGAEREVEALFGGLLFAKQAVVYSCRPRHPIIS